MELAIQAPHLIEYKNIIATHSQHRGEAGRRQFIYRLLENYFDVSDSIILFISSRPFII